MAKLARKTNAEHERRDTSKGKGGLDFHRSSPEAIPCLLSVERHRLQRFRSIHEMACGDGALVLPLRQAGFHVIANDIVARGCPDSSVADFLDRDRDHIMGRIAGVTNPPFNRAEEFVVRACEEYEYVAMVLRLRYLGPNHFIDVDGRENKSTGAPIWQRTRIPFARVIIPPKRFSMMHRDTFRGTRTESGMIDFAWFIWERGHTGSARIVRAPMNACEAA